MSEFYKGKVVMVTGSTGFLGGYLSQQLHNVGVRFFSMMSKNLVENDLDLRGPVKGRPPELVFHLAARVGGIGENQRHPASLLHDNVMMGMKVFDACRREGVDKLVAVGTVCSYPKHCPAPFREEDLWNGYPEETNAPYGIAKKLLSVASRAYREQYGFNSIVAYPTNLYGEGDNFNASGHVIPAIIRKIAEARRERRTTVTLWGDGTATRQFLHAHDAARALCFLGEHYDSSDPINISAGREYTIAELAEMIARALEWQVQVVWDTSRPNGQPRRLVSAEKLEALGWKPQYDFDSELKALCQSYRV